MLIYPCRICYLPYHDFLIAKDAQGICIVLLGLSKGCLIWGPVITGFALGFRHTLIFLSLAKWKRQRELTCSFLALFAAQSTTAPPGGDLFQPNQQQYQLNQQQFPQNRQQFPQNQQPVFFQAPGGFMIPKAQGATPTPGQVLQQRAGPQGAGVTFMPPATSGGQYLMSTPTTTTPIVGPGQVIMVYFILWAINTD